jgi:hypothetical protein
VVADPGGYLSSFELELPSWFIIYSVTLPSGTLLQGCGLHEARRHEPCGMAFSDGTAQVRAARAGLRPALLHELEPKCFGLTGNRMRQETRRGCAGRYAGCRPGLVWERSAPFASLPLIVTIATKIATSKTVQARTGAKFPP